MISDYTGKQGTPELSVTKGQQVEVIDMNCPGAPDYCIVRLTNPSSDNVLHEGLVPVSILKPTPTSGSAQQKCANSNSKRDIEHQLDGEFVFP